MQPTPERGRSTGRTILLVDDNLDELMIYSALLSHAGHDVVAARDFDGALETARSRRPDMAVVDLHLGGGLRDGCDLIEALRAMPETADMPVIVHTAFGDVYGGRLERAGCAHVIHKPADPRELLRSLAELLPPD